MRETGKVIEIHEGFAEIRMNASDCCSSCQSGSMCRIIGTADRQILLPLNGLDAKPGDLVDIDTPARSLLSAAFVIFIFPILIAGLISFLAFRLTHSNHSATMAFFGGFLAAEFLIFLLDRFLGKTSFFAPRIIRKIED
jgi:positive regulator of sigma E activity